VSWWTGENLFSIWLGILDVFYNVPVLIWFLSPSNGHSRDSRKHLLMLPVKIGNGGKGNWTEAVSSAAVCRLSNCHMLVARWSQKNTGLQLQYISWNFNYQLRLQAEEHWKKYIISRHSNHICPLTQNSSSEISWYIYLIIKNKETNVLNIRFVKLCKIL